MKEELLTQRAVAKVFVGEAKPDTRDPHLGFSIDHVLRQNPEIAQEFDNTCFANGLVKQLRGEEEYFMLSTADAPNHLRPYARLVKELQALGWEYNSKM